ncbi:hypothetical protein BDV11DRAFT_175897 [Aspergillus similis]
MAVTVSIEFPQDALAFAYLYGYPLYAYACYVGAFSNPKVNTPYPFRNLATPEDRAVVRPNVDTLYTPLFFDVSQTDLEFVIPEFDNRYWLWPWYDLYGNNFANIGRDRKASCYSEPLGNNWTQPAASISGNFGSHYAARMFSAQRGYLILSRDQAAYPGYTNPGCASGADRFFIGPEEAYILTFASGMPRLKESGFWSLTIYGEDQFLVPNDRGVYNLGDRSGLVDRDGRELERGEGREFKILIQAADAYPPQEWVKNWLPAPRGEGTFMMSFRFYGAEEAMFDGTWVYPVVEKVGALRA